MRAAEIASGNGMAVTVFDAKPSVGRKFLVAGRGGLNLTKDEPRDVFATRYAGPDQPEGFWQSLIAEFDSGALRAWAAGLGVETFVASSKRVYPKEMKAAPLLRRWLQRLRAAGVEFAMRHRWTGITRSGDRLAFTFETDDGPKTVQADAGILALGGGSWPETGSDGGWLEPVHTLGIQTSPLVSANCGWETAWSAEVLEAAEGEPLKNVSALAGGHEAIGELLVTRYGLEGGIIYQLGPALRAMELPIITIDLKPSLSVEQLVAKLGPIRRNFLVEACQRWKLSKAAAALLAFSQRLNPASSCEEIAAACKACSIPLDRPRPIAEAISSAGGICWAELDHDLMLKKMPGLFVAGEMIDWEAPTGGYLMQGCFATGTRAGRAAAAWASRI